MTELAVIDTDRVRSATPWHELRAAIGDVLRSDLATAPDRHVHEVDLPDGATGSLLVMPSWIGGELIGVKAVTYVPTNAGTPVPTINADGLQRASRGVVRSIHQSDPCRRPTGGRPRRTAPGIGVVRCSEAGPRRAACTKEGEAQSCVSNRSHFHERSAVHCSRSRSSSPPPVSPTPNPNHRAISRPTTHTSRSHRVSRRGRR